MSRLFFTLVALLSALFTAAQQQPEWTPLHNEVDIVTDKAVGRQSYPEVFRLFQANLGNIRQLMMSITGTNASERKTTITLPAADGSMEKFEVVEASNFTAELQARFPEIRAFSGRSLTHPGSTLKISIDPDEIQTMVFRDGAETEYMEKYSADGSIYAVFRRQRAAGELPWTCSTPDQQLAQSVNKGVQMFAVTNGSGNVLRTLRLAQSCNAEYANYFGAFSSADVAKVLAAFNATLTRCNGVYEKDLALHLNLIANTDKVIYYNPSTDPYTTLSSWNNQLQSALTTNIGEANYDIGHMFGASGGGGNAGCIGCICVDGSKGKGITSPADNIPKGDNFDIDYVAHEVGHQLGANHTFSHSTEGTGQNKEVGSGITIMGYAGITSHDVARHSIDIFHETSIEQILVNLNVKTCDVQTTTPNTAPTVTVPSGFTIPISTPFALTGSATDAAGQSLTYCWEQNDNASSTQTGSNSVASPTKTGGPNWLTFYPTSSPTRIFPKLSTILSGANVTGPPTGADAGVNIEALSSVARNLNFRLTVRDNVLYNSVTPDVGQTAYGNVAVTVSGTSGPFAVTAPNTAVSWENGSAQNITWSVNNTNLSPISCTQVNILLSTDGGNTFSMLLANTPNDGTQEVTINATGPFPISKCRIKVEAVGNIFFDIGNADFTINSSTSLCGIPGSLQASSISTTGATLSWEAVTDATSYKVEYKTSAATYWTALPAQAETSVTLSGLIAATTYDWRVLATCSAGTGNFATSQFTTIAEPTSCPGPLDLTTNGTISGAAIIPFNQDVKGLINPKGDVDHFKFSLVTGGTISLSLSTLPTNYDLRLLNNIGTILATSARNGSNNESISYTATAGTYYAQVYSSKSNFNTTGCYTLRINPGTASRDGTVERSVSSDISTVRAYPNPTHDRLYIDAPWDSGNAEVTLISAQGKTAVKATLSREQNSLELSGLSPGLYIVRVMDGARKAHLTKVILN